MFIQREIHHNANSVTQSPKTCHSPKVGLDLVFQEWIKLKSVRNDMHVAGYDVGYTIQHLETNQA